MSAPKIIDIERLIENRMLKGLSLREVAQIEGVSFQAIQQAEAAVGIRQFTKEALKIILADLYHHRQEFQSAFEKELRGAPPRARALCAECRVTLSEEGVIRANCKDCLNTKFRKACPVDYVCTGCGTTYRPSWGVHRQRQFHGFGDNYCSRRCYLVSKPFGRVGGKIDALRAEIWKIA